MMIVMIMMITSVEDMHRKPQTISFHSRNIIWEDQRTGGKIHTTTYISLRRIRGSHSGDYEELYLPGYNAV
jgi:hypothetical protein